MYYPALPIVIDHGKGVYVYNTEGVEYMDLLGGLGCVSFGHANPRIAKTITE
jgi:acetylornithine/succinyldiaminopimelate/putrescine aminotransferase